MEYTKVCGIVRDKGASGFYRIEQPLTFLDDENGFDVAVGGSGSDMDNSLFQLLQTCDVVILPHATNEESLRLVTVMKDMSPSKKVIVDHDDNIFIDNNKDSIKIAKEILEKADGVFVSTTKLADVYGEYNKNITVLPSSLDFNIWKPYKIEKDNNTIITWHGDSSNYEDLNEVSAELKNISGKHNNVKIVQYGLVDINVHPYKQILLNTDIGVIPLADNKFNQYNSSIKWVEYSALGIPCVVKDIEPYSKLITHGVNGFLYTNTEEFEFWVDKLVEHPPLRQRIGEAAQKYVHEHFDARKNSKYWSEAIKHIMEKKCLSLH
jgi:glycosyltransferase involved in cell wall biosynthesis